MMKRIACAVLLLIAIAGCDLSAPLNVACVGAVDSALSCRVSGFVDANLSWHN